MSYDFAAQYAGFNDSTGGNFADLISSPGLQITFCNFKTPTVIRPFAFPMALVPDNMRRMMQVTGNPLTAPWRINGGVGAFTPWLYVVPKVVKYAGTERKATFINICTDLDDRAETPYDRLRARLAAQPKGSTYQELTKGSDNQGAAAGFPSNMIALQGYILSKGGENYYDQPKVQCLLLAKSASNALVDWLAEPAPGASPAMPLDQQFVSGDVVGPTTGAALRFMDKKLVDAEQAQQRAMNGGFAAAPGGNTQFAPRGASVMQANQYAVTKMGVMPVPEEVMLENFQPWENLKRISAEEMVMHLCSAFLPDVIKLAFRDSAFEPMVPAHVRDRFFTSPQGVGMPATPPAAAAPYAPTQQPWQQHGEPAATPPYQASQPAAFRPQVAMPPAAPVQVQAPASMTPDPATVPPPAGVSPGVSASMDRLRSIQQLAAAANGDMQKAG